ncbi:MAG: hypothetical protein GTO18_12690 [Anaerolineales bacterium]|nr:hypothetical protein [Anaerolineales bacterium]
MEVYVSEIDFFHLRKAIDFALDPEEEGNLPIGCIVSFDGRNVVEGKKTILVPEFNPIRHTDIEALMCISRDLWANSRMKSSYSTLEPCLGCTAAIL